MSTVVWIVIGIVAVPLLWWAVRVATSLIVPVSVSGRAYLKQRLIQLGIDPRYVPEACVDEFVTIAQKLSSIPVRPNVVKFRADVVCHLDTFAELFVLWKKNPGDSMFRNYGNDKNWYREIFERYGIK
jgi:hypothetical protein